MANKNNSAKKNTQKGAKPESKAVSINKKAEKNNEGAKVGLPFKITALALAVIALGLIVFGLIKLFKKDDIKSSLNYMEDDLSNYVSISRDDYVGYKVTINIPEPSARNVEEAINKLLYNERKTPEDGLHYVRNATIAVGDTAAIYYRGYILNDDGTKNYFNGGCNFNTAKNHELGIGSGGFIEGFEYNLIGKNEKDYAAMTKITTGKVDPATDIVLVEYSVTYGDGTSLKDQSTTISLFDPEIDELFGAGFAEYWQTHEATVGGGSHIITTASIKEGGSAEDVYTISVTEAYRIDRGANGDKDVLEIEAYFPNNYDEATLAGKTAHFEVFIRGVQKYDTPAFDDTFVTETLKLTAEDLAEYEGDTLAEKYKDKIYTEQMEEHEAAVEDAIAEAFWDHILKVSEYKALPELDVQSYYNDLYSQIYSAYEQYKDMYDFTLDSFATYYMGLTTGADWQASLRADAETSIKQKLSFYYIIREEGFIPSDEEYQKMYNEMYEEQVQSYLDYYGISIDDADYETKLQEAKNTIDSMYDDAYWEMQVIFVYGMEKICGLADVTNTAKQ